MGKLAPDIKKRISECKFFIVLSTKNYLRDLRNDDSDISVQINIARELNKQFFIIKDRRLSQDDIEEIRKYFSNDNIIKEITVDIGNNNSAKIIASEIRDTMACMYPCENGIIGLVTPYQDEN